METLEGGGRAGAVVNGDALKVLREGYPLTLRELADLSGVSVSTISGIENKHRNANPSTVRKLAESLGANPGELMKVVG